jgi:hypothetical protein
MTLDDANEIARALLGRRPPPGVVRAAVIMLAPAIKGFGVGEIVGATGYTRNAVERVTTNLVRWGIWGEETWRADWPEFFVTKFENMSEERFQQLAMSFMLDAMVGAGMLFRTHEDGEFKYGAISNV